MDNNSIDGEYRFSPRNVRGVRVQYKSINSDWARLLNDTQCDRSDEKRPGPCNLLRETSVKLMKESQVAPSEDTYSQMLSFRLYFRMSYSRVQVFIAQ